MNKNIKKLDMMLRSGGASQCLLIGGAVIDRIYGRPVKDWDIEVYGLSYDGIAETLKANGLPVNMVGQSFGIIKTEIGGLDIDLNVPRRDSKCGVGHKGFVSEMDPFMTPTEAGRRRDLTMNSMYLNIETGQIQDPFGGIKDLESGILRATDPETFVEDPLRVLRVMQLLARKGKTVAQETVELCRSIHDTFSDLPKERVFEEFLKLLMKAEKPSLGLEFLKESGWLSHFPELNALVGCEQNPDHHPEGDVWEHTLLVVDMAARLKTSVPEEWREALMFGALCHDFGKPATSLPNGQAHGHDVAGEEPTLSFLSRLTDKKSLVERVASIVVTHMRCGALHRAEAKESAWKRLHNVLRLDIAAAMSYCDSESRYSTKVDAEHGPSKTAMHYFKKFGSNPIEPVVLGRHLIGAGLKPGPDFKGILDKAYQYQLDTGMSSVEDILDYVL